MGWDAVDAITVTLLFFCAHRLWLLDRDFARQIRDHNSIFDDLRRIEEKIRHIHGDLTELRNRDK